MTIEIRHEPPSALAAYARVPIAFEVRERLAVVAPDAGLAGLRLVPEPVTPPYTKDYDAEPGHHPTAWARRFDVARWGILAAYAGTERVGGAVVVGAPDVELLDGRTDLAVLWDLRVAPARRRQGVGAALFRAAEAWAVARGAAWLRVETQNVNVAACRFYARQGCVLGAVDRFAYPELPGETQLLWYRPLRAGGAAG
jgi:ribosomal protein S18 acetylase RimI-like enzyme